MLYFAAFVQIGLTLLGAVMTLQEEKWVARYRKIVLVAFVILGIIGVYATLKIGLESDVSSEKLATTVDSLASSTNELARLQTLNTALQQKLLESTNTITGLAKEGISISTGGNSLAYVAIEYDARVDKYQVIAVQHGEYPIADITVKMFESGKQLKPLLNQSVGTLPVKGIRELDWIKLPAATEHKIVATFSARNGAWDQFILLRPVGKDWRSATRVQRNPGQVDTSTIANPAEILMDKMDPEFPNKPQEADWGAFAGYSRYCEECR